MADGIPETYKAVIYDRPGTISTSIIELPTPSPGPGEVLVRLTHSGVCHSDLGIMTHRSHGLPSPIELGQIGGHEGVGVIVAHGPDVVETPSLSLGSRVGIGWVRGICNSCAACYAGYDGNCLNHKISGYSAPGTFQQYVLAPANYLTPIPRGLTSETAAPMLCAGVTVYSALRQGGAQCGEWIAILGAGGGLGHLATQIAARAMGMRVIGVDAGAAKAALAVECGAEEFVDFTHGDSQLLEQVQSVTHGLGVQAVLVLTAANSAYASAIPLLKFGGTCVCVGTPEGEFMPIASAFPQRLVARAQKIVGVAGGSRKDAVDILELVERGVVKPQVRVVNMADLTHVFEDMDGGKITGRVVVDLLG